MSIWFVVIEHIYTIVTGRIVYILCTYVEIFLEKNLSWVCIFDWKLRAKTFSWLITASLTLAFYIIMIFIEVDILKKKQHYNNEFNIIMQFTGRETWMWTNTIALVQDCCDLQWQKHTLCSWGATQIVVYGIWFYWWISWISCCECQWIRKCKVVRSRNLETCSGIPWYWRE